MLRVHLLGGLDVEGVDERELGSRKARTLLKVLALGRGAAVGADAVVDALWPGDDMPAKPVDQVGVLVSRLRAVLGADRLARSDAGWSLAVDWLDVAELDVRVDEAAARLAAGNPAAARAAARAALALVRGDLLADEPDPTWAEAVRAATARTIARARLIGAEAALAAGDPTDAAALAEGALDHDGYDEAALRVVMRAYAAAGRPASALGAYARVRERLAEDLGVDPSPETEELHTAILLGEAAGPVPDRRVSGLAPVGRDGEMRLLDGLLDRSRAGEQLLTVVEGEPGIGKTALVVHWARRLPPDVVVLRGRCDELGRDLPLQPILDGLAAHLRGLAPEAVARCLGDAEPVLGPLLGRFGQMSQAGATIVADPVAGRALLFASLLAAIERVAGSGPTVVVCEDVHLAGASTIEWLRFAVRRGTRLLVVASARPGVTGLGGAELIELGPLDPEAVAQLVGRDRAGELFVRSGGNPLFLLELAHATSPELPTSVREAVATRVDALGEAAGTLRAAAVLGSIVDVDLLAGVVDLPVTVLLEHLDAGLRTMLIEERSAAFTFRHELVREALVAGTAAARRAYIHREAARVLRGRPGHDPMEAAWHARAGGDIATAVSALVDAAAVAAARYDMPLADDLLGQAVTLGDSVQARTARARVRIARRDLDGAEADAAQALELGGGPPSLELAGWAAYYRRDYGVALQRAEEAMARTADPGLRASCLTLSGRILHASGRIGDADERLSEAVTTAPPAMRGTAQVFLGALRVHQGRVGDGGELVERALVDGAEIAHPFAVHHGHLFRVLALGMQSRPVEAFLAVDAGRLAATHSGESGAWFVPIQDNLRSWLLRNVGRLDEAAECTVQVLEFTGGRRSTMSEMYFAAKLDLIEGCQLAGDRAGATAAIGATAEVLGWNGAHAWHHRQRFLTLRAAAELAGGRHEAAAATADAVIADGVERRTSRYPLLARVVGARARLAGGEPIDREALEGVLVELEGCAGLEVWRVTAELAAATSDEWWWRDAERRAGALVVRAGDHGEHLRRYVAATFAALGRR